MPITHINLNSLTGGLALGFEHANPDIKTLAFYEFNKPCRYTLEQYWPEALVCPTIEEFMRGVRKHVKEGRVDIVSGRYRKPKDWSVIRQAVDAFRPRALVIEGMATMRSRGLIEILQDLWSLGYDAEGHVISACSFGTIYKGERFWLIAHPHGHGRPESSELEEIEGAVGKQFITDNLLDGYRIWSEGHGQPARGAVPSQPRILRRDEGFSRRVDSARVRVLSDDVSPVVASFIGFCVAKVLNDEFTAISIDDLDNLDNIANAEKKTAYVLNMAQLEAAKIPYTFKNGGVHLVIKTPNGATIDYWPSTDVYIVRKTKVRGFGCKNVISMFATL